MIPRNEYLKLSREERFIKLESTEKERAKKLFKENLIVDMHTHIFGSIHFEWDANISKKVHNTGIDVCF